jgi:ABC-type Fe3+/spermidine/putrescine transport system ATPase subunit
LRCIAGFTNVDSGEIILDGEVINEKPPHKRGTGMVFQNYALFPHLSVASNIGYGLKIRKVPKPEIKKKVDELLNLIQLEGMGGRRIDQLSGGQQQRVAFARALSLDPKVLLLDEPLSNLDANLRVTMRAEIKRLQKQLNLTVIFVTHDQEEAMSISDRVMILSNGLIEQAGSPIDIYDQPINEFIAGFVGYVNIIRGKITNIETDLGLIWVETDLGIIEVFSKGKEFKIQNTVKLVIRPENLKVIPVNGIKRNNVIWGDIFNSLYTGSLIKYIVDVPNHRFITEQHNPRRDGVLKIGQKIGLEVSKDLHILRE